MLQLRPGEGSSKMVEVDAFYSPHLQQQPQVRFSGISDTLCVLREVHDPHTGRHRLRPQVLGLSFAFRTAANSRALDYSAYVVIIRLLIS
jgi:hypothetical protein